MLDARPYSYRDDPAVPQFEDSGPVVFMDGACALCTGAARLIARLDKAGDFRICPVESALGQRVLTHYGLDPRDPETWLYLEEGRAYGSLAGVLRAAAGRLGARVGAVGRAAAPGTRLDLSADRAQPAEAVWAS